MSQIWLLKYFMNVISKFLVMSFKFRYQLLKDWKKKIPEKKTVFLNFQKQGTCDCQRFKFSRKKLFIWPLNPPFLHHYQNKFRQRAKFHSSERNEFFFFQFFQFPSRILLMGYWSTGQLVCATSDMLLCLEGSPWSIQMMCGVSAINSVYCESLGGTNCETFRDGYVFFSVVYWVWL